MGDSVIPEAPTRDSAGRDAASLSGTVLEGKYGVARLVAEGGFSIVYAGEHMALGIRVAIKTLKSVARRGEPDAWLARFHEEARLVARIEHPNVVRVFDTGVYAPHTAACPIPWMVLEWLEGETLQEHLAARRGMGGRSPKECLPWIRALFSAVAAAHRAGVAHRDIKPSNILLTRAGAGRESQPKLLDFGIAKVMAGEARPSSGETATESDFRAFSTHYAAPEQLAGARTGPWTDVHALGLLVTELLTDSPAYASDDPGVLGELIFGARRPTVQRLGSSVGPWEPILQKMLARRSQERPTDLQAVLSELEATVDQADAVWTPCSTQDARVSSVAGETASRTRTLAPTSSRPKPEARNRRWLWFVAPGIFGIALFAGQVSRQSAPVSAMRAPAAVSVPVPTLHATTQIKAEKPSILPIASASSSHEPKPAAKKQPRLPHVLPSVPPKSTAALSVTPFNSDGGVEPYTLE